jgi:hypothetical protein
MSQSLFTLRNQLAPVSDRGSYLELNPAVVSGQGRDRFALSAVYIGPSDRGRSGPLSMKVVCDDDTATLQAIGEQSERIGAEQNLTVALFSVSRAFLEMLAWAADVRVEVGFEAEHQAHRMEPANRANVASFLSSLDAQPAAVPAGTAA